MKKMILTAVMLAAAALCRAQQPAETGERREWLTSFTAVEVSAPLDVKFVQVPDTEAPKIVYDTKGSYTTKFRAEVKDKVLRITERSDARRPDRTSVTVYYNSLERVEMCIRDRFRDAVVPVARECEALAVAADDAVEDVAAAAAEQHHVARLQARGVGAGRQHDLVALAAQQGPHACLLYTSFFFISLHSSSSLPAL